MLLDFVLGATSIILRVKLRDSTTGLGKTAIDSSSAGLVISTIADNEATPTTYSVAGSTIETITTIGTFAAPTATKCRFKKVDDTNHPGVYEIQLANARYAVSNAKSLLVSWSGVSGLADGDALIPLRSVNPYDGAAFGLSRLDASVNAVKSKTDNLPSDPADASDIVSAFSTVNTSLGTIAGYLDTEVAAIKAKTDNLPSDPADESVILAAIAGISGGGGLDAQGVRDAIGLADADLDNQLAALPTSAEIVTAIKADTEWKTLLANVNGVFTFDDDTGVLVLKNKAGNVTLATLTLTRNGSGIITDRASA